MHYYVEMTKTHGTESVHWNSLKHVRPRSCSRCRFDLVSGLYMCTTGGTTTAL